jgi:hypothetical protein
LKNEIFLGENEFQIQSTAMRFLLLLAVAHCGLLLHHASAYSEPENAPVDRLIQMGEKAMRANPNNVDAVYMLARTHYLAFACATSS